MIKLFLLISLFFTITQARENPFFPSEGEKDVTYTSNEDRTIPQLKRATLMLPPQARVIKKVIVEYKNLDGSIGTKSIPLNNKVDWHLPIFVSQSYISGEKEREETDPQSQQIEPETPKIQEQIKTVFLEIGDIGFAKYLVSQKSFRIKTKDKIIRDFMLVTPYRIVIDFKRDDSFKSLTKLIDDSYFTMIRVGNHKGYYRVVLELDAQYKYSVKKLEDGCVIELL